MRTLSKFHFKKSFFPVHSSATSVEACSKYSKSLNSQNFKFNILLSFFFKYFDQQHFNVFFGLFYSHKLLNPKFLKSKNFSTDDRSRQITYYILHFYKIWKLVEYFFVQESTKFLIPFLLKKPIILKMYKNLALLVFENYEKNFFYLGQAPSKDTLILDFLIKKLKYLDIYTRNFNSLMCYTSTQQTFLIANLLLFKLKNNFSISWSYVGFQAFLNTHMFLCRNFLEINCLATGSLDFLLLKNFNKIFFRTGDFTKNYWFNKLFVWGKWNAIFWKGEPYYTFNRDQNWTNLISFPTFDQTTKILPTKNRFVSIFFNTLL